MLRVTGIPWSRITALKRSLSMQTRRGGVVGADVRDAGHLEEPLQPPVLAERPVQDRQDDLDAGQSRRDLAPTRPERAAAECPRQGRRPGPGLAGRMPEGRAQRPSRPISSGTTSNRAGSSASITERAEASEIGCSRRAAAHAGRATADGGVLTATGVVSSVGRRRRSWSSVGRRGASSVVVGIGRRRCVGGGACSGRP